MSELRILVVEDDSILLNKIFLALSNNNGDLWIKIKSCDRNVFEGIFVSTASNMRLAKKLIKEQERYHLLILDKAVDIDEGSNTKGDALTLIPHSIAFGNISNAVISLTGTDKNLGRNYIRKFYRESNYDVLGKYDNDDSTTVNELISLLTQEDEFNNLSMPKILSLVLSKGYVTIIKKAKVNSNQTSIWLKFSETNKEFEVKHKRTRILLNYLGWESPDRSITYRYFAELLDMKTKEGNTQENINAISSEMTKISKEITDLMGIVGDTEFVTTYIFENNRNSGLNEGGYRLIQSVATDY